MSELITVTAAHWDALEAVARAGKALRVAGNDASTSDDVGDQLCAEFEQALDALEAAEAKQGGAVTLAWNAGGLDVAGFAELLAKQLRALAERHVP